MIERRHKIRQQRGLSLAEAAFYVGVSVDVFNAMVADGRMPPPKLLGTVRRFDVELLDIYFSQLPDDLRNAAQRRPGNFAGVARRTYFPPTDT